MSKVTFFLGLTFCFLGFAFLTTAQVADNDKVAVFKDLNEALKNPEKVFKLDLSNQTIDVSADIWDQFVNLEYLSLRNDHLKTLPKGISKLRKLKVLDLSGNDFVKLPSSIKKLKSLEELYLNDESNMNVMKSIPVLKRLPNLKSLHIENDHLTTFPTRLFGLKNLEELYLNENDIQEIPKNLKIPSHMKLIDLRMNKIGKEIDKENKIGQGVIIKL